DEENGSMLQIERLKIELTRLKEVIDAKDIQINSLETRNDIGNELLSEIKTIYPQTDLCIYSEANMFTDTTTVETKLNLIVFHSYKGVYTDEQKAQIRKWVRKRLKTEAIKVYFFY